MIKIIDKLLKALANRKFEMVISDVDGTLVEWSKPLTPETIKAVEKIKEKGVKFSLATGRSLKASTKFMDALCVSELMILFNGARIYDPVSNEYPFRKTIDEEIVVKVLGEINERELGSVFLAGERIMTATPTRYVRDFEAHDGIELEIVDSSAIIEELEPTKIMIIDSEKRIDELTSELSYLSSGCTLSRTASTYLEIIPKNIDKGFALEELSRISGISLDKIIALGDNQNDSNMLKKAGLGIAISPAYQEVADSADIVIKNTPDFVFSMISKYI